MEYFDSLRKEKIYFVYGIANKRYYQIIKRLLQYKDICALNFFAKPIKIRKRPLFGGVFNLIIFSLNFIIDTFSKKAWAFKLKRKSGKEITRVMEPFLEQQRPLKIEFDQGKEFYNTLFLNLLKD